MNFMHNTGIMIDFINLTKEEFLKLYSHIAEQEYDNTVVIFHLS
ncbi:hypothetical protein [Bacteroides neonati]|nr:hypothetical protein [Bacteroides neonati]